MQVGDTVVIYKKCLDDVLWVDGMEDTIGKTGVIKNIEFGYYGNKDMIMVYRLIIDNKYYWFSKRSLKSIRFAKLKRILK